MKSPLRIADYAAAEERGRHTLRARVLVDGGSHVLWFRWRGKAPSCVADAFVLPLLQLGMMSGRDVEAHAPVSSRLACSVDALQDDLAARATGLQPIRAALPAVQGAKRAREGAVAVLFDGGVDAYYSFMHAQQEIERIVFVAGVFPEETRFRRWGHVLKTEAERIKWIARELRRGFCLVESNLGLVLGRLGPKFALHPILLQAMTAAVLEEELARLIVPTRTADPHKGLSSFAPLIRPDTSSAVIGRDAKKLALAADRRVVESLRVCWENPARTYNCGKCKRCSRTIPVRRLLESLSRRDTKIHGNCSFYL